MTIKLFLFVMLLYVVIDIVWAKYTQAIAKNNVLAASSCATIIPILSAFVVLQYIHNIYVLIPMAIGSFIGTYIALKYF